MFSVLKEQWVKKWFNGLKPLKKIAAAIIAPLACIEGFLSGFIKAWWFTFVDRG